MSKLKLFIENFLVYGLGGVLSKAVPFFMLPIITRLIPDSTYYGMSDLSNTIVSFGTAFAIMGMYDAAFRMFFDKEEDHYKKVICSTTLIFTICASVIVCLLLVIFRRTFSLAIFGDTKYFNLIFISAFSILVGAANSILMIPTRTQNKRKIYLSLNVLSSVISYSIAIPLLLSGYYITALPLSMAISMLVSDIIFAIINHKWFRFKLFDKKKLKELLIIAVPLLPNFLIYWVFNSCDRIMISKMLGYNFTGIYSAGAKLGSVSQLIYIAFSGGWQYFAFYTMKEENQDKLNSRIFEYLGVISFTACMFMCSWSYMVFNIIFTGDYVDGYVIAPYLFFAPLLQMLFQIACNQFLVIKKTWPNMIILSSGAILNVIANFCLIPLLGIEGAAIATLLGYAVADVVCMFVLCRMKLMETTKRFMVATLLLLCYIVTWRIFFRTDTIISTIIALVIAFIYFQLYREDIMLLFKRKHRDNF